MVLKACATCGTPSDKTYCRTHRPRKPSATQRGYGYAHQQRRKRALQLQDHCQDCGTTENLQLDDLPSSWTRQSQGLPVRLGIDVELTCGPCNLARGAARGANVTRL